MAINKKTNRQIIVQKTKHKKLRTKQHEPPLKTGGLIYIRKTVYSSTSNHILVFVTNLFLELFLKYCLNFANLIVCHYDNVITIQSYIYIFYKCPFRNECSLKSVIMWRPVQLRLETA